MNTAVIILLFLNFSVSAFLLYRALFPSRREGGRAYVIIRDGRINAEALRLAGITLDTVCERARLSGYFNLGDVDCAVAERSGEISFLPKPQSRALNPKDFNFSPQREGLCTPIVKKGVLQEDALALSGVSRDEVLQILNSGGRKTENILLATISEAGRVDVFEENI